MVLDILRLIQKPKIAKRQLASTQLLYVDSLVLYVDSLDNTDTMSITIQIQNPTQQPTQQLPNIATPDHPSRVKSR